MKYLLILLFLFSNHSLSKEETVTVQDVKKYLKGIEVINLKQNLFRTKIFCEYDDVRFNNKQYLNKDAYVKMTNAKRN